MNIIKKLNEKQKSPLIKPCGNVDDITINKEYLMFFSHWYIPFYLRG
ncbi:hypothetical protein FORC88_4450 [Salmonella enterica subsp. enterica serovar Typhimurium]|nr:hypothetical protein SEEOR701_09276 [Salmonella enterica subsp. enterica serovar Oranienburg str. 701]QCK21600.1 hypothetical protein FORC88_4450 [Salmonella enterica subsp. enterica serovar Typhimurium]